MMDFAAAEYREAGSTMANVWKGFDFLMNNQVLVGIPDANSSREKGKLTNAQLMYLQSVGSPVCHIPARPVIEPALNDQETQKRIQDYLIKGISAALAGNIEGAKTEWAKAGMVGANASREYITSGNLAPNAPITIHGGYMRNHITHEIIHVKGKGSSRPLIDTGALRKSITYVVRRKRFGQ